MLNYYEKLCPHHNHCTTNSLDTDPILHMNMNPLQPGVKEGKLGEAWDRGRENGDGTVCLTL